jgi:hypothetical protein
VLQALERPLEYLAADDFRRAAETKLPLDAIAARIARARAGADVATAAILAELDDVVRALQARTGEAAALLRRARGLVDRLRASPDTREWRDYRASDGVTAAALAKLAAPVATLRAVGPKRRADLVRFGLPTVEDVLFHLPFRYEDRRRVSRMADLMIGIEAGTVGVVRDVNERRVGRGRRPLLEVVLEDGPAALQLVWFNQLAYFKNRFRPGQRLFVHGRVEAPMVGPLRMAHPDVVALGPGDDPAVHAGVVPIYEKPTPWPVSAMRRIVQAAVADHADAVPAAIPPSVAARQQIMDPARALRYVHEPPATVDLSTLVAAESMPHRSLIFDELFFLQLGLALRRSASVQEVGTAYPASARTGAGAPRGTPVSCDASAGARVRGDRRRPGRAASNAAAPAGRRRQRQDPGGADGRTRGRRDRRTGRHHGADRAARGATPRHDLDVGRFARRSGGPLDGRGEGRGAPGGHGRHRERRHGDRGRNACTHPGRGHVPAARARRRRRAAPLRRDAARGTPAPGGRRRRARRARHERDADPAHTRADALRRPGGLDAGRAAARADADPYRARP